ncbi:MAG: hypothetical protein ACI8ZB_003160 [Desulforhopalus sp.]|jgi:hypothetical protein
MILLSKINEALRILSLMSTIWIGPSLLFHLLSYTSIGELFSSQTVSFLTIVFFVILLSNIMAIFFKFERDFLYKHNTERRNLIVILIIARLLLFQVESIGSLTGVLAGIAGTTSLILFSCLLGSYLSQAIKRFAELIPVCSVAFTVDLYSVLKGPSKEIAIQIGDFYGGGAIGPVPYVDIILLKIANPATNHLIPIFGVSDWIFVVFITSTMQKFKISDSIIGKDINNVVNAQNMQFYFPLVSFALLVSIFTAYLFNVFIPALPVMIMIVLPWVIIKNRNLFQWKATDFCLTLVPPVLAIIIFCFTN